MSADDIRHATRTWIEQVVIALDLCPFAASSLRLDRIRIAISPTTSEDELLVTLQDEMALLDEDSAIETTLLVHPHVLTHFAQYNQFLDVVDASLRASGQTGVYQVASFHPDYQFAGTHQDDAENYTNRSPFPMLHILREEGIERALLRYPKNIADVPIENVERMRQLGRANLEALLAACRARD